MTAAEIVEEIRPLGKESYRKVLLRHGVPEPVFGVKIEDMKKIQKRVKKDYQLALDLYDTGIYDAMYLAGLIADDEKMTRKDLRHWLTQSTCRMLNQYTVPWVAAGSKHGHDLALEWIDSKKENVAVAGWCTFGSLVSIKPDEELDLGELRQFLTRIKTSIHQQPNWVRYAMNGFVIAAGCFVRDLTETALQTATGIGTVSVDMGDNDCKVPSAAEYIHKVQERGSIGKKRKSAKC